MRSLEAPSQDSGTSPQIATRSGGAASRLSLGGAPLLALTAAGGLMMVALGNNAARLGTGGAQPLFWGGLVAIYMPIALRLLSVSASREERLALALLLGGMLYLVKVIYNPTEFTLHDELATWRQTSDLISTGHPLSQNPLVTGYSGFPGLELLTAALTQLTGLSIFTSGLVVIGVARVALMLALFLFLERASGSTRAAGIGMAVYACNPSFLYFDSQFGYESLALVVGAALLLTALRWSDPRSPGRDWNAAGLIAAMAILAVTLAVTHHMTSYAVVGFLFIWALAIVFSHGEALLPQATWPKSRFAFLRARWIEGPGLPALLLAISAAAWFVFEAGQVTTIELGGVFTSALESVVHLVLGGGSGPKTLFQSGGQTNTTIARMLGVASIVPLLVVIPLGLWRTWREANPNPLWRALALVAFLYPVTLLLRLTQAGTETSQRASEFVYVGLAFVSGLLLSGLPSSGGIARRVSRSLGLGALATVVFLGGFIIGESPVTRQPGSFLVGGEARAVSPQGIAAAQFAAAELPPGSRVIADRPNSTLVSSYGKLDRVTGSIEGIPVTRIFSSGTFDATDQRVVSNDKIEYIVVDNRLSHETPASGYYFESTEPNANSYRKPISSFALSKFNHVRGISKIFGNGVIAIYDTSGLRSR